MEYYSSTGIGVTRSVHHYVTRIMRGILPAINRRMEQWKKHSERRKHCALAVVTRSQKFSPRRRPLPRGAGPPKFNQLELVTTFTYRPSLVKIDARNFELSW